MAEPEKKRILIVDDDKALGDLLAGFFTKSGFETKTAVKGGEGLEIFSALKPHLVLLDILLPDMNGMNVLKKMLDKPAAKDCAFILMSGVMKDQKTRTEAISKHGAHAFIEKPFKVREMHNTILKCLHLEEIEEKKAPPPAAAAKAAPAAPKVPVIPEPEVVLEGGELGAVDLPRLLAAFFTAKASGVLKLNHGETVKAIYFEEGKPIFAASNAPGDKFGEICVRLGLVTQAQVDEALKKTTDQSRIGTVLVQSGVIAASDLYSLIQGQVREIILGLFAWSSGRYAYQFENLAGREIIKLQTPPADLVIEGIRRFYNLDRLQKLVVSNERVLDKAPNPQFRFQQLHLTGNDAKIFDLINGRRTITQIISEIKLQPMAVLQLIYALLTMKIVQDKTS